PAPEHWPPRSEQASRPSEAISISVRWRKGAQSSVIPLAGSHLSAEYVIGHGGVGEDEGDDEKRTDQRKAHAFRRPGGFPDRYGRWNDVRPQADRKTSIAQEQQQEREQER